MRIANAAESQVGPKSPVMYLSPVVELMNTLMGLCSQMLQERNKKKRTQKNPKLPDLPNHRIFNLLIKASAFFKQIVTMPFSFL